MEKIYILYQNSRIYSNFLIIIIYKTEQCFNNILNLPKVSNFIPIRIFLLICWIIVTLQDEQGQHVLYLCYLNNHHTVIIMVVKIFVMHYKVVWYWKQYVIYLYLQYIVNECNLSWFSWTVYKMVVWYIVVYLYWMFTYDFKIIDSN